MICPTCGAEMSPGRIYGASELRYLQGVARPDLWTNIGTPIGIEGAYAGPSLGELVEDVVLQTTPTAKSGVAYQPRVVTHRCDRCRIHLIDEAENKATIALDNARIGACARCGKQGYGRSYTTHYGRIVAPDAASGAPAGGAVPAPPAAQPRYEGSEDLFLCNGCLRRIYGWRNALLAAISLIVAVLLFAFSVWLIFANDGVWIIWPFLMAVVGAGFVALAWSLFKDAMSNQRDPSEGQEAALRILRERNVRGDGIVFWKPEKEQGLPAQRP